MMTDLHEEVASMFARMEGHTAGFEPLNGYHVCRDPEAKSRLAQESRRFACPIDAAKSRAYKTEWEARKRAEERASRPRVEHRVAECKRPSTAKARKPSALERLRMFTSGTGVYVGRKVA